MQLEQINQSKRKPRPPFRMPKSTSRSTSPVSLVTADGKHRKRRLFWIEKNECTTHLVSQTELLRQTEQALSDLNEKATQTLQSVERQKSLDKPIYNPVQ